MTQFSFYQPQTVITVTQLNSYLRQLLENDEALQDLWVEGEISNFSRATSGHLYFTLKDSAASIRCVMWRNAAARLNFSPREGLAVEVHGNMNVYEVSGQVQLYVDAIRPAGEGALFQEFLRLKAELEAQGLFDADRKRPIPERPGVIGIVTSATGAALQDMLNTIRRRFPIAEVVISPTIVQGIDAPPSIVSALQRLNDEVHPDVILIGRGGGSIEDLWAFNDEGVVRAVAASTSPIISGVGHETDFTLTDFAADLRAVTPTAAAELATPDRMKLLGSIAETANLHTAHLREMISSRRLGLGQASNDLVLRSPAYRINILRQKLDEISQHLDRTIHHQLERKTLQFENLKKSLQDLNPQAILNRGYAIVTRLKDGEVVKNAAQVEADQEVHIQVSLGNMNARITQTNPREIL